MKNKAILDMPENCEERRMNKAVLVINEPDICRYCILWHREYYGRDLYTDYCAGIPMAQIHDIDIYHEKPDWCPLIPEPERLIAIHSATGYDELSWNHGWNACLDALEGKENE